METAATSWNVGRKPRVQDLKHITTHKNDGRIGLAESTPPRQAERRLIWQRVLWGKHPKWMVFRLLLLIAASAIVFKVILLPVRITGKSMEPTCHDGQLGLINSLAYVWHPPRRGDIVGFRLDNEKQIIIKRVIGLPGEQIAFHTGTVLINGEKLSEPYLTGQGAWEWPEETLGRNTYFVSGDNRIITQEFRVEGSKILGKFYNWQR